MADKRDIEEKLRKEMDKILKNSKILRPEPWPADLLPDPELFPDPETKKE